MGLCTRTYQHEGVHTHTQYIHVHTKYLLVLSYKLDTEKHEDMLSTEIMIMVCVASPVQYSIATYQLTISICAAEASTQLTVTTQARLKPLKTSYFSFSSLLAFTLHCSYLTYVKSKMDAQVLEKCFAIFIT